MICIVLDATKPLKHKKIIEHELEGFGIRLNKTPPQISLVKKAKGGVSISRMCDTPSIEDDTIKMILKEYKIASADVCLR